MPWEYDASHSLIEFGSKHLGIATIKGRFTKAEVTLHIDGEDPTRSRVAVVIDATSLSSDLERRDLQLRSEAHLDVERHPTITFASRRIDSHGDRYVIFGDLTIRGVTREVGLETVFHGEVVDPRGLTRLGFTASTVITRADFNLPSEPGPIPVVGEEIRIDLEVEAIKRDG